MPSPVRVRLESNDQVLAEWQTTTWSTDDVLDEQRFAGVLYRVTGHTGPETDTDAVDTDAVDLYRIRAQRLDDLPTDAYIDRQVAQQQDTGP